MRRAGIGLILSLGALAAGLGIHGDLGRAAIGDGPATILQGPGGNQAVAVAVADVNGDGVGDAVFADDEFTALRTFLGQAGSGPHGEPVTTDSESDAGAVPLDLALGDLDGDGRPDAVIAGRQGEREPEPLRLFAGDGAGGFGARSDAFGLRGSAAGVVAVAIADVVGDADLDVIAGGTNGLRVYSPTGTAGSFQEVAARLTSTQITSLDVGDLTGDGRADVAATGLPRNAWTLTGGASLSAATAVPGAAGLEPSVIRLAPVTQPPRRDLVMLKLGNPGSLFVRGSATPLSLDLAAGVDPFLVEAADVDGDGRVDLVVGSLRRSCADTTVCGNDNSLRILFSQDGGFGAPVPIPFRAPANQSSAELQPSDIGLGDLNGDGLSDIVVASNDDTNRYGVFTGEQRVLPRPVDPTPVDPTPSSRECAGRRATIVGTDGADTLRGTPAADVIAALAGDDTITGGEGNDLVCAGPGADRVIAGAGDDTTYGEADADRIAGGAGRDTLAGGAGRDTVGGGGGADLISGNGGRDALTGGGGFDLLLGGTGPDRLFGNRGNDRLNGGAGSDLSSGGGGRDRCVAETRISCER